VERGPFRGAIAEVRRWLGRVAPTGHRFVPIAQEVFGRMHPREDVLVHGDLHHYNLLRHADHWVVVDPKPLIAEPEFDVVTLLWNPLTFVPTPASVERRIRLLAETGLDERRIRDWATVRGTYLGLPLDPDEDEARSRQLGVVRCLVEP
jgi:streptomycin 6-kinase